MTEYENKRVDELKANIEKLENKVTYYTNMNKEKNIDCYNTLIDNLNEQIKVEKKYLKILSK